MTSRVYKVDMEKNAAPALLFWLEWPSILNKWAEVVLSLVNQLDQESQTRVSWEQESNSCHDWSYVEHTFPDSWLFDCHTNCPTRSDRDSCSLSPHSGCLSLCHWKQGPVTRPVSGRRADRLSTIRWLQIWFPSEQSQSEWLSLTWLFLSNWLLDSYSRDRFRQFPRSAQYHLWSITHPLYNSSWLLPTWASSAKHPVRIKQ